MDKGLKICFSKFSDKILKAKGVKKMLKTNPIDPEYRLQSRLWSEFKKQIISKNKLTLNHLDKWFKKGLDFKFNKGIEIFLNLLKDGYINEEILQWMIKKKIVFKQEELEPFLKTNLTWFDFHPYAWLKTDFKNSNQESWAKTENKFKLIKMVFPETFFVLPEGNTFWHDLVLHQNQDLNEFLKTENMSNTIEWMKEASLEVIPLFKRNFQGQTPLHLCLKKDDDLIQESDLRLLSLFLKVEKNGWSWMNGKGKTVIELYEKYKQGKNQISSIEQNLDSCLQQFQLNQNLQRVDENQIDKAKEKKIRL